MGKIRVDPEFAELCRQEHVRLVGLLALYVGDRAVAEDLAQETFVRLHQHWPRVRAMASPHAWISTVALNLARSWWRRRRAQRRADREGGSWRGEHAVEAECAEVLEVRAAVAALPDQQRAALLMRYYARLSVDEAAVALGCEAGTVTSLVHSAINALRLTLEDVDDMIELADVVDG